MTPTTMETVAADFVEQIRQITPDYPTQQDQTWEPVESVEQVPGAKTRLFFCEWTPGVPMEDGIYGSAIEYVSHLYVWTNYRSVDHIRTQQSHDVASAMITADARQLWITLQERCDPTVAGLLFVNPVDWTPEEDDEGHEWGYHEFEVRYLVSHTL